MNDISSLIASTAKSVTGKKDYAFGAKALGGIASVSPVFSLLFGSAIEDARLRGEQQNKIASYMSQAGGSLFGTTDVKAATNTFNQLDQLRKQDQVNGTNTLQNSELYKQNKKQFDNIAGIKDDTPRVVPSTTPKVTPDFSKLTSALDSIEKNTSDTVSLLSGMKALLSSDKISAESVEPIAAESAMEKQLQSLEIPNQQNTLSSLDQTSTLNIVPPQRRARKSALTPKNYIKAKPSVAKSSPMVSNLFNAMVAKSGIASNIKNYNNKAVTNNFNNPTSSTSFVTQNVSDLSTAFETSSVTNNNTTAAPTVAPIPVMDTPAESTVPSIPFSLPSIKKPIAAKTVASKPTPAVPKGAKGVAAKSAGKSLIKKIPILGAVAGLGFAAQRAFSGDFVGAGLEAASGIASTLPGIGTAASLALDAAGAARDSGLIGTPQQTDTTAALKEAVSTAAEAAPVPIINNITNNNVTNNSSGGSSGSQNILPIIRTYESSFERMQLSSHWGRPV